MPLPNSAIAAVDLDSVLARFHELHQQEYGHQFVSSPIELVNLRVTAIGELPKIGVPKKPDGKSLDDARIRLDKTIFRDGMELKSFDTSFFDRARLPPDQEFPGPAIILQTDSTTVVPPGCTAELQTTGCLVIRLIADAHSD